MIEMKPFFSFFVALFLFLPVFAHAQSAETIFVSTDGLMQISAPAKTFSKSVQIDLKTVETSEMSESILSDSSHTLVGQIYLFDLTDKTLYNGKRPLFVEIKYPQTELTSGLLHGRRTISFYNKTKSRWEMLPSQDDPQSSLVRARIHLPYTRLAIFEEALPEFGAASWYGYKNCDCAASPDYPKGTRLLVTSVADPKKSVIVRVNDYGPDRAIHPDRIIDLDKLAFKKLAKLGAGVINVRVELLKK